MGAVTLFASGSIVTRSPAISSFFVGIRVTKKRATWLAGSLRVLPHARASLSVSPGVHHSAGMVKMICSGASFLFERLCTTYEIHALDCHVVGGVGGNSSLSLSQKRFLFLSVAPMCTTPWVSFASFFECGPLNTCILSTTLVFCLSHFCMKLCTRELGPQPTARMNAGMQGLSQSCALKAATDSCEGFWSNPRPEPCHC